MARSARTPNRAALGINSRSNCNRFGDASAVETAMPVTFAPGRLRLATSPTATGLLAVRKIVDVVVVAAFAASDARVPPATITGDDLVVIISGLGA
jgi:hypothetical protein